MIKKFFLSIFIIRLEKIPISKKRFARNNKYLMFNFNLRIFLQLFFILLFLLNTFLKSKKIKQSFQLTSGHFGSEYVAWLSGNVIAFIVELTDESWSAAVRIFADLLFLRNKKLLCNWNFNLKSVGDFTVRTFAPQKQNFYADQIWRFSLRQQEREMLKRKLEVIGDIRLHKSHFTLLIT